MKKAVLTETTDQLPEEFALAERRPEEFIERLILLEKIDKSRQHVREGKTYTTGEARQRLRSFF